MRSSTQTAVIPGMQHLLATSKAATRGQVAVAQQDCCSSGRRGGRRSAVLRGVGPDATNLPGGWVGGGRIRDDQKRHITNVATHYMMGQGWPEATSILTRA